VRARSTKPWLDDTIEQADGGGLASAVMTQETKDFSRIHFKRKVVDCDSVFEMASELVN
jgi:regulation of enolase protein 1 (concanavalin A-like superfamily)